MSDPFERQRLAQEKAQPGFDRWRRFLHLADFGWGSATFLRVKTAVEEVGEQRRANNYRGGSYETEILAIRVAADTFATQIAEAGAATGQDPTTIRWVIAGLRCPRTPFCTGCDACQTVISPQRAERL